VEFERESQASGPEVNIISTIGYLHERGVIRVTQNRMEKGRFGPTYENISVTAYRIIIIVST
jgi:hypothetical protein